MEIIIGTIIITNIQIILVVLYTMFSKDDEYYLWRLTINNFHYILLVSITISYILSRR